MQWINDRKIILIFSVSTPEDRTICAILAQIIIIILIITVISLSAPRPFPSFPLIALEGKFALRRTRTWSGKQHISNIVLRLVYFHQHYYFYSYHHHQNEIIQPAGLKGLRAESARAVTGRQCHHSGVGEDFLVRRPVFFRETNENNESHFLLCYFPSRVRFD